MDRITDAESMVDILIRKSKLKVLAPARLKMIEQQLRTNAIFELAEAVETLSGRPIQKGVGQDFYDWLSTHPRQAAWLDEQSDRGNLFAQSLRNGLKKFGSLTEKQQAALNAIVQEQS